MLVWLGEVWRDGHSILCIMLCFAMYDRIAEMLINQSKQKVQRLKSHRTLACCQTLRMPASYNAPPSSKIPTYSPRDDPRKPVEIPDVVVFSCRQHTIFASAYTMHVSKSH